LRHLPGIGLFGPPTDEDPSVGSDQHEADIAAVETRHKRA
jgi:hypothetical protein